MRPLTVVFALLAYAFAAQVPVESTDSHSEAAQAPVAAVQIPAEAAHAPAEAAQVPVESTHSPVKAMHAPAAPAKPPAEERVLGDLDVARIRQLHHITDVMGDDIWPGFDIRKIPVAVNNDDREEMLVGHPNPPGEFVPFGDHELDGRPVMIRDGCTRYGPRGGGWAVDLGGEETGYVSVLEKGRDTEGYLSLLLHECFHCFQKTIRKRAEGARGETPETDPVYSALIGLESRILKAILDEPKEKAARKLCEMFVAVRHERRKDLPKHLVLMEGEQEYGEGTATYSQVRMYQLLIERGGLEPAEGVEDPQYGGFKNARKLYERELAGILPYGKRPITFFHSMYQHGMAQCLVLDRMRPGWKKEMGKKGSTQFGLLEKEFPVSPAKKKKLVAEAKKRFDYDDIFKGQKKLIDERLDEIRVFVLARGRRYRIYHDELPGGFNWKPEGPVYHVPESIEEELRAMLKEKKPKATHSHHRTVWAGGLRRFDKEGLILESGDVPMIYGTEYIEWIDPDPAPNKKDMKIESDRQKKDIYYGLKIVTDGFTLTTDKARIKWSKKIVEIHPMQK